MKIEPMAAYIVGRTMMTRTTTASGLVTPQSTSIPMPVARIISKGPDAPDWIEVGGYYAHKQLAGINLGTGPSLDKVFEAEDFVARCTEVEDILDVEERK